MADPLSVKCPKCRAFIGARCRDRFGAKRVSGVLSITYILVPPHKARVELAGKEKKNG